MRLFFSFFLAALSLVAEPADWIVSARYVVTVDPQHRIIENGALAIRGGKILAVGTAAEINRAYQPKNRLNKQDALIAPGLINTHTHAAMSLLRGIADDKRLQDWLEHYIFPAEAKNVNAEFVRWGTRLACLEMLLSGTTTYTDMYYFEEVVAQVTKEAGMRGVLGETVIGFPVADAKTPEEALARTAKFLDTWGTDALIVPAIAPHAIYTNSAETLKAARALADRFHAPLVIHLSETKKEVDDSLAKNHMTPVQYLDSLGVLNGRTIAAHGVWLSDDDIGILKARNTGIAHCPSSNMKLASGAAPVVKLQAAGVHVGLGPDGPAGSNNDFNLFEEMDLAAKLQKLVTLDPEALPARTAIDMATIEGARVLGMDARIGSLEVGKEADLITVQLDKANAIPLYGVESQLVYALKGSDVNDVMVAGKLLVRDRKPLTLDSAAIFRKAREYQVSVAASLK